MSVKDANLAGSPAISVQSGRDNALLRYFGRFDEGEVIRWAFRGLLAGAVGVLVFDFQDLWGNQPLFSSEPTSHLAAPAVLPPAVTVRGGDDASATVDPRENVTTDEAALRAPVVFALRQGGLLAVEGYIDTGSKARFEAELAARGRDHRRPRVVVDGAVEHARADHLDGRAEERLLGLRRRVQFRCGDGDEAGVQACRLRGLLQFGEREPIGSGGHPLAVGDEGEDALGLLFGIATGHGQARMREREGTVPRSSTSASRWAGSMRPSVAVGSETSSRREIRSMRSRSPSSRSGARTAASLAERKKAL